MTSNDGPRSKGPLNNSRSKYIIIIGGCLTGLILAQALRNVNRKHPEAPHFTFDLYERDSHAFARGGGWSLTIHWALTDLRNVLPMEIIERFEDCLVNPEAAERKDPGNFQFLNLKTGEKQHIWPIPLGAASRVARHKLMALLMEGLNIQWFKGLERITYPTDSTVSAHFSDGTNVTGDLLIGCDRANSAVRRSLCPTISQTNRLPVRMIGLSMERPLSDIQKCLAIDPHFFQGGDPDSNVYFWHSFIDLPRSADERTTATCQLMMSWPHCKGFMGRDEPLEVPESVEEKLALIRELSTGWAALFKELVFGTPEDADLREIVLADWPPQKGAWDKHNGTVSLVGDAAHAMTMFRGEAANHGVIDVSTLIKRLGSTLGESSRVTLKEVIDDYEEEMITRTRPAVFKSRQACIDANNFSSVNSESPLISRRAVKD